MALKDYIYNKPIIKSKRLVLRVMTHDDIDSLREWMPDKSLYKYWGKNPGKADLDPSLLFARAEKPTKSFHLGIELAEEGKVIGDLWVYLIEGDRMANVAVRVSGKYQGCGYGSEALSAAVGFCFEHTELQRLWSGVDVRNISSWRMMEKCGFVREGLIRSGKMCSMWCDYYVYGLLKSDYNSKAQSAVASACD